MTGDPLARAATAMPTRRDAESSLALDDIEAGKVVCSHRHHRQVVVDTRLRHCLAVTSGSCLKCVAVGGPNVLDERVADFWLKCCMAYEGNDCAHGLAPVAAGWTLNSNSTDPPRLAPVLVRIQVRLDEPKMV